jgi:hypothetical protein
MIGRQTMASTFSVPAGPELKGGVLVFFPSYGVLEGLKKRWTETGLWEKLRSVMGSIVVETKSGSVAGTDRANHFGGARAESASGSKAKADVDVASSDSVAESAMAAFESAINSSGGKCVLLAVCRYNSLVEACAVYNLMKYAGENFLRA